MSEWFNQIVENVKAWCQSPLGTTIISITTTFIYILIFLSKTSLGKKLYNKMKAKVEQIGETAHESNEKVKEIQNVANEKIAQIEGAYDEKLNAIVNYALETEQFLYLLGETIPNEKVKKLVEDYRNNRATRFAEIQKYVPTVAQIEELKQELKEQQENFASELERAKNEIEQTLREEYQKAFQKILEENKHE